ncbi:MAG TPA: OmpA family protein [Flavilitoribacter sp.]|nr:OmpA family protein [Flavilitoribacter sp.]HMQ86358.1 OmpA family protein [Flavilitoribacter sp.]
MKHTLHFILISLLISGCLPQKNNVEMEESLSYYKRESLAADSLRIANRKLQEDLGEQGAEVRRLMQDMEQLQATNVGLNRSYQEVLGQYNALVSQNKEIITNTSYENLSLQEQLASQQNQLDKKERDLAMMEYNLKQKEQDLNVMQYNYTEAKGNLNDKEQKIAELQAMLALKEQKMKSLRTSVNQALTGFTSDDLSVTEKNGKLYLSLSQNLLFSSGSDEINWQGKKALQQVADALNKNPDIDITVEGHTDTDGTASRNWDLSVLRATSVVKVLTQYNVSPARIIASGRGFYAPVASNNTPLGKAQNRRTEIVLSPKLDELYNIINE